MPRDNGGLIGSWRTIAAAGSWSLEDQCIYRRAGLWELNDPYLSSVSLLLHMDGANNSTTFVDSSNNAFSVTPSGDAKISTAQSKFGNSSGLFDGSGDYLTVANNSAFNFGTGDFTIEAWVYLVANSGDFFIASSSGSGGMFFGYRNSTSPVGWGVGRTAVAWDYVSGSTSTTGSWNHVAVCRQDTTLRIFVNGTQVGSTSNSQSYNLSTTSLTLASQGANYYLNGYIDDLRITKGVARYGFFTPPTAAFPDSLAGDASFSSVSLLLHMDGANNSTTFTDSSGNSLAVTRNGDAKISTTQSKFGGSSCYLDGTGDYLTLASSSLFGFGTGDFTIEYWTYPTRNTINETFIDTRPSDSGTPLVLGKSSSGAVRCYDGTTIRTGGTITLNTWSHVAWVRSGSTNTIYLNGSSVISFSNAFDAGASRSLVLGSNVLTSAENCQGYFDDIRITKGVARYTANFTPPAAPFPNT